MSEYNEKSGEYKQQGEYKSTYTPQQQQKKDSDLGSWIFIAVMFAIAWPIGLFLLISKLSDGSRRRTGSTGKITLESAASKVNQVVAEHRTSQRTASVTKTPQYSAKGTKIMKIVGAALAILGALAVIGTLAENTWYIEYGYWWDFIMKMFFPTGMLAGGIAVLLGGRGMTKRNRRFGKYLAVAGKREAVPIAWLAKAAEVSERKTEKDLELMIERGLWGEEAYVDVGNGMLFRSPAAASEYFRGQKKPAVEAPVQADEGYSGILRQIRRANDRIADPALSAKIDRLEDVAGKIFRIIEKEPAKKDKASTFLNYYLPTTQKLLDAYAEFEEAGVSGENLTQAKAKIQQTMDNVVAGFEKQLDELYHADAMDIDSDIRVMETMLRRDNGSAEEDFGLGAYAAQEEIE